MEKLTDAIERGIFADCEIRSHYRPDRWIELHVYPADEGAVVFFKDITDLRRSERQAAQARSLLQSSLDALSAHVVILDRTGTIVASNMAWQKFAVAHGLVSSPIDGHLNYITLYAEPLARCPEAKVIAEILSSLIAGRRRAARMVYSWLQDGRPCWFQLGAARFDCGGETYLVVTNEDVTAAKETQRALGEACNQLLTLQEEERQRIAEELHDSTAQHLVAIGLNVMGLKGGLLPGQKWHGLVREIEGSLEEASKEIRSLAYLLHPPHLEEDAFRLMVRRYVDGFCTRAGLRARVGVSPAVDTLPVALQRSTFRIIQEGLANVHRHASASRVSVDIRCLQGRLHLVVSDNGRGMSGSAKAGGRSRQPSAMGVGIASMRARLRQFGGELQIQSGSKGTVLHATVPLCAVSGAGGPASAVEPRPI